MYINLCFSIIKVIYLNEDEICYYNVGVKEKYLKLKKIVTSSNIDNFCLELKII